MFCRTGPPGEHEPRVTVGEPRETGAIFKPTVTGGVADEDSLAGELKGAGEFKELTVTSFKEIF